MARRRNESGVCTKCGREDAYTMIGRCYCAECAEKTRIATAAWRRTNTGRAYYLAKAKADRADAKAAGLCTVCKRRAARPGRTTCKQCAIRNAANQAKRRRRTHEADGVNWPRGANGYCVICNKCQARPGATTCHTCHDRLSAAATTRKPAQGHAWRWRQL